ncbi:FAD-binding domain-containing protein [Nakamurella sp. PAMC28650]|uniref:FAD-binding domain-containing protein n=1 Tax=Nakamurella sp. PAMC28650 TaxID=2762325 RepID=UPI00164D122D|nr:FAD-binding domain-containing protein [Nakamurella sp. PAMC28650]QNK80820.1 deoxyribodipyrimidine photolyase [Nakamurella sp. PAMC28650]
MPLLPDPPSITDGATTEDVVRWVADHLGDLTLEGPDGIAAGGFRGGQQAADQALATLDITGYARDRSVVLPVERRGASRMSPYIRHGLLSLPAVWSAVADAPTRDRGKYRDELLWQEFARHLYARVGAASREPLTRAQPAAVGWAAEPWPAEMNCMDSMVGELHEHGWLVNQTRMWLASQWAVRAGADWRDGEQEMFVHLLDGSRAANRLGWQWTVGTGSGKPYGFSRWQVQKRAPQLCRDCKLASACPIEQWPDAGPGRVVDGPDLDKGPIPAGPVEVVGAGTGEQVWLTAESLGVSDPALAADAGRPAVFVFDEPLLTRLRLSGKRLVFLAETLGELAASRPLEVRRGVVAQELAGRSLAATWTPVPGWSRISGRLEPDEVHPWPWLVRPGPASVRSFSAWRRDSHR